ncbi:von Willebrand factor A domain-containing protein 5A-like isoform X2 [Mytilus edulis]|uniref:von Willebrand factor A domain-containing protein 5A-like isoform X2 n=1 Tax=Mytilus edulis TaxID=6550 RepID=UPI0039F0302D
MAMMADRKFLYGLIIEGKDTTVPLKESKVHVTVQGLIANVDSQLTYSNDTHEALQTSFIFPMDDMSAVYKFEADVNNKHIIAECQDKQKAKETYSEAISSGHTAMLLSEDDASGDIFECKLGNLPAGEKALLTISYVVELSVETDGKVRFTLPTVLTPRYSPVVGHYVEPGSESSPGQVDIRTPCRFTFSAAVSGCYNIKSVSSPNDKLNVKVNEDKSSASIDLAEEFKFDHDLSFDIIYDNINEPEIILELGNKEKDGLLKEDLLMLNFYPDLKQGEDTEDSKREFIFVIDRSGSMSNVRIKKAKETLLLLLKSLPVGCLFNVVSFGSDFSTLFEQSEEYSEKTLDQALSLQAQMEADMGGTEILQPLQQIYSKNCKQGYPRQIFLLTDGGVSNTEEVIKLAKKNNGNTRVFTFGIGDGASTSLIKNVAKASNGKAIFIKDNDNMQAKVITAMKGSLDNCLSEVSLHWDIPKCFTITDIPKEPPVVFHGDKLVLFALLKSSDAKSGISGSFKLKGRFGGKDISHKVKIEIPSSSHNDLPLHRVAAKYQIKELENDDDSSYRRDGSNKDKIVLVSQAANIISKYTAFVGVDKDSKVPVSVLQEEQPFDDYEYDCLSRSGLSGSGMHPQMMMRRSMPQANSSFQCSSDFSGSGMHPQMMMQSSGLMPATSSCKPKKGISFGMPSIFKSKKSKQKQSGSVKMRMDSQSPSPPMAPQSMPRKSIERSEFVCDSMDTYEDLESSDVYFDMSPVRSHGAVRYQDIALGGNDRSHNLEKSEKTKSSGDKMMVIVSLQNFDGSWSQSSELELVLNITQKELEAKYKGNIWCTAIVVAFLEKNFSKRKSEWEMINNKAIKWLTSQDREGKGVTQIIEEANDIIKTI